MLNPVRLQGIEFAAVTVNDRVTWPFALITDFQGATAVAEFKYSHAGAGFDRLLAELFGSLKGKEIEVESDVGGLLELGIDRLRADFDLATAVSALRNAVVELQCQHAGISMTEALGGAPAESIALYANINHSVYRRRDTYEFTRAAERAVEDGFDTVKCAPFDYLPLAPASENTVEAARPGLEQVAAVRLAVGPDVQVLVDCHSRFDEHTAPLIAERLAESGIGWFEEPLQPNDDPDGLARVTGLVAIPVAGGEGGYGEGFFADLVRDGAVDIIMPDVKHCGGVTEARRAGAAAQVAGGRTSLHGPASPISQLAGAHVTAAIPGAMPLEYAANEAPWRTELLTEPEHIRGGRLWFPGGTGMGASLNLDLVASRGTR
jgi:galactonate dehydratase